MGAWYALGLDVEGPDPLLAIPAGWPAEIGGGCARLDPTISPHTLRHSFATHLFISDPNPDRQGGEGRFLIRRRRTVRKHPASA